MAADDPKDDRVGTRDALAFAGADKFDAVQELLDTNILIINQINSNHTSRTPQALAQNVALINDLNANIGKVAALYKQLAAGLAAPPQSQSQPQQAPTTAALHSTAAGGALR